jgi:hypothetical protein
MSVIINIMERLLEAANKSKKKFTCPKPTQDVELNLRNRQKAIKSQNYGPANPALKNAKFWSEKSKMWDDIPVTEAKTMLCGNCAAFDRSPEMLKCIREGIGDEEPDGYDTVKAGTLGYCHMLKFKCAAARTCDAWVTRKKAE